MAPRELFAANTRLVGYVLHLRPLYIARDEDEDRQEGYIGLLKAAETWDPARGTFATYASECIWREIQKGRGRRYGVDYRRAVSGKGFYQSPVSLGAVDLWEDDGYCDRLADRPLLAEVDVERDELILWLCDLLTERERIAVLDPDITSAAERLGIAKASVQRVRVRAYERLRKIVDAA